MEQYAPVGLAVLSTLALLSVGAAARMGWLRVRDRRARLSDPGSKRSATAPGSRRTLLGLAAVVALLGSAGAAVLLIRDRDPAAISQSAAARSESPLNQEGPSPQENEGNGKPTETDLPPNSAGSKRKADAERPSGSGTPPPAPGSFTVSVLNGAGVTGLAAETAVELESQGFGVGPILDAPATRSESVVMHVSGAEDAARVVGRELDIRQLEPATEEIAAIAVGTDVMVVLGDDVASRTGDGD